MTAPTAREVLDRITLEGCWCDGVDICAAHQLADRVEKVLSEIERVRSTIGGDPYHSSAKIIRILNGEEP